MPPVTLGSPAGTWDCHVHCFDPDRYPYKIARAYTPRAAPLHALFQNLLTRNVMLVQASIEHDFTGLLAKLKECHSASYHFAGLARGTILADNETRLPTLSNKELEQMHLLGVRCIRLHGSYGGAGHDVEWVKSEMTALARLKPVLEFGWIISAQLPLETWSRLKPYILKDPHLSKATIVADHVACAGAADFGSSVIEAMEPIVRLFSQSAPRALLWGSDWPHVDASHNDFEAGPLEGVQASHELAIVESWLSKEQRQYMLVDNPRCLFGT
jgi:predicted TIM-barrel fold metal-dependent hydrolase